MKAVWFVDANVFLRFFTEDDQAQADKAERLLRRAAAGRLLLVTGPPALFEVAWTLRRAYRMPRNKVFHILRVILSMPGLKILDRAVANQAIQLGEKNNVDFADAYIAASADSYHCNGVATFNVRDFKHMGASLARF